MKEVVVVVGENIDFVVSLVVRNKKGSISRKELYSNEFGLLRYLPDLNWREPGESETISLP